MGFQDQSIKRKTMAVMMLAAVAVLVLSAAAFTVYDLLNYRQAMGRNLNATAGIIAEHSADLLAAGKADELQPTLALLHTDTRIAAAALYDTQGRLLARYPAQLPESEFPAAPGVGQRFEGTRLILFQPVKEKNTQLGTLYILSDPHRLFQRLQVYGGIVLLILFGSMLAAFGLSLALERRITQPILALARAARMVSEKGDYSVRVERMSRDETGELTEAFNGMLSRIQEQTAALRQSEQGRSFLAAIVESSDDAIAGNDLSGNVVSWNAGAERMFGYTAAEMLGQPITRLLSRDRPQDELRMLELARKGETRNYETVRVRKDGRTVEISLTLSPIRNSRGEIIGISSIARDITELKRAGRELHESQALLSGVIETAMDAIISVDAGQRVTLFNGAAEKMFGCPAAQALGQPLDRFIPERFRQGNRPYAANYSQSGATSRDLGDLRLIRGLRTNGEEFPIEASISHVGVDGQPVYTIILRDVTERKRSEEQILELNTQLEQRVRERTQELSAANQELESFTYSVAHDLRAPLRHIDAFARILHEDFDASLPEDAQHYLANIRRSAAKMSQLVDDLLNLARVGRQELKRNPTALNVLVDDVLSDLKSETAGRVINWQVHPLPVAKCDPGLMKQVFANLLSNAVKYTRPRTATTIEVGFIKTNGDNAVFVRDNGVGFNMKYADKLFGVFQRLHRAEDFEGTGVGLATVDRIVRKHGGSIWAEAAVDKGATFYFTIPGMSEPVEAPLINAGAVPT